MGWLNYVVPIFAAIIVSIAAPIIIRWYNKRIEVREEYESAIITWGSRVAIRVFRGLFASADLHQNGDIYGTAPKIQLWEIFEIRLPDEPHVSQPKNRYLKFGDKIAFRAVNNNDHTGFVSANLNSQGELTSSAPWVKEWEIFEVFTPPNSSRRKVCPSATAIP